MIEHAKDPQSPPLKRRWGIADYLWFVAKNIIGWVLILGSFVVGPAVPGPGGIPMFFIGFGLITLPGKRRLTARVLRGIPVDGESRSYKVFVALAAVSISGVITLFTAIDPWIIVTNSRASRAALLIVMFGAVATLLWILGLRGVHLINMLLRWTPRVRRKVRPWLRARGIDLLPPRRRHRLAHRDSPLDEEIIEIHERHIDRLRTLWRAARPWLIRLLRAAFIIGVFAWMLKPIYRNWHDPAVRKHVLGTDWGSFAIAAAMFAVFLFVFRAMAWRRILAGLGPRLPVAPATRIWSFSELARYMPGVIWQVVGRVYLSRPYGVNAAISSASQLLELAVFMLANIIVALACLLAVGIRWLPRDRMHWIITAAAFVPVLLLLLHPPVFYGILNGILRRLRKPLITHTLPRRVLLGVLLWNILGLLWQCLAIWILTHDVLRLPLSKWYVLAGAYCLAWTIGFSVGFLSPGGMGIRELVFVTTMQMILPAQWVQQHLSFSPEAFNMFLRFLGVLLRLWAICGELTMAGLAFLFDYRGAMGRADAPGRAAEQQP